MNGRYGLYFKKIDTMTNIKILNEDLKKIIDIIFMLN